MNRADLSKWLAGHRPPPAKVMAVVGGKEHQLAIAQGAGRNVKTAAVILDLRRRASALVQRRG